MMGWIFVCIPRQALAWAKNVIPKLLAAIVCADGPFR